MWAQSTDPANGCHRTGVRASFDTATNPKLPPCAPLTPRPPISCLQLACATGALRLQLLLCLLHRPILLRRNLAQLLESSHMLPSAPRCSPATQLRSSEQLEASRRRADPRCRPHVLCLETARPLPEMFLENPSFSSFSPDISYLKSHTDEVAESSAKLPDLGSASI